jgi:hypothetical protein
MSLDQISNQTIKVGLQKYEKVFDKGIAEAASLEQQTLTQLKAIQHYLRTKKVALSTEFTVEKNELRWSRPSVKQDYSFELGNRKIDDWTLAEKVAVLQYMPQYIEIIGDKMTKLLAEAQLVLSPFVPN